MSERHQVAWNVVTNWVAVASQTLLGAITVPLLISALGRDGFGIATLLNTVVSLIIMIDLGLRGAIGRFLTEAAVRLDDVGLFEYFNSALLLWLLFAIVACITAILLGQPLVRWLNVSPAHAADFLRLTTIYVAPATALSLLQPAFSALLASHNRFDVVNAIAFVTNIARAVVLIALFEINYLTLASWGLTMTATAAFGFVCTYVASALFFPHIRVALRRQPNPDRLRQLCTLGFKSFLLEVAATLNDRAAPIIIARYLGAPHLATFAPGFTVVSSMRPLVAAIATQLYPLTTRHHVANDQDSLRYTLIAGTRHTLILGILLSALFAVFASDIFSLWLGAQLGADLPQSLRVFGVLLLFELTNYAAGVQWPMLLAVNRIGFLVKTQLPLTIACICLSVYLVRSLDCGVMGVVWPLLLMGLIRRPLSAWYVCRQVRLPLRDYIRCAYTRPLVFAGVGWAVLSYWRSLFTPLGFLQLAVSMSMALLLMVIIAFALGLNSSERHTLYRLLLKIMPIRSPHPLS